MIESKEQYEAWIKLRDPGEGARRGHYDYQAYLTIEALREVARAGEKHYKLEHNGEDIRRVTLNELRDKLRALPDWVLEW